MVRNLVTLLEKVILTYLEGFVTVLMAGNAFGDVSAYQAAGVAAIPAALTVVANGVDTLEVDSGSAVVDGFARVVRTYVVSFIGFLVAAPVFSFSTELWQTAAVSAIPAALALVKSIAAARLGNPETAALLPIGVDSPSWE